jgi:hypothetical protein
VAAAGASATITASGLPAAGAVVGIVASVMALTRMYSKDP